MQKHTPYHLLHKKLTGEINSAESNLLDKLMEVDIDAEYSSLENELGEIWDQAEGYSPNVVFDPDAAFAKFQDRIKSEQADQSTEQVQEQAPEQVKDIKIENEGQPAKVMRMKPYGRLLPLAASFLLLIVSAFLLKSFFADKMISENAADLYVMEDDSKIWLNENSNITYSESFKSDRTVELSGEAYFQVARSAEPFIVKTAAGTVEAIGTQFTVDTDGKNIEVGVVEGSVELVYGDDSEIIRENQKAYNEDGKIEVKEVSSRNIANWRKAGLSFKSDNLNTVVNDLQTYFGVDIIIGSHKDVDTACKAITSPNVPHNSSIESFFDNILATTHKIDYTKNADGSFTINKFSCSK